MEELRIYQAGEENFFSDKNLRNPLTIKGEEGKRFFLKEKDGITKVFLSDCKIIDFSIYRWRDVYFYKNKLGKLQKVKYSAKDGGNIFLHQHWVFLQESSVIDLKKNPYPKFMKLWLWILIVLGVLLIIGFVFWKHQSEEVTIISPEKKELKVENRFEVPVYTYLETIPRKFFFPAFHIPDDVKNKVYVIYHEERNLSWCFMNGEVVPDSIFKITKGKTELLFEGKKNALFEGIGFFIYYPKEYDPKTHYMFSFDEK